MNRQPPASPLSPGAESTVINIPPPTRENRPAFAAATKGRNGGGGATSLLLRVIAAGLLVWIVIVLLKIQSASSIDKTTKHLDKHNPMPQVPLNPTKVAPIATPTNAENEHQQQQQHESDGPLVEASGEPVDDADPFNSNNKGSSPKDGQQAAGDAGDEDELDTHPTTGTNLDQKRRDMVQEALRHSWTGYKKHAFGFDEFAPISKRRSNWGGGRGIGSTIVDALDTLILAGETDAVKECVEWIHSSLNYDQNAKVSVFETTIRVVGGLLSAYQHTGDRGILEKAKDLGDRLMPAFNTPSGIPDNYCNLHSGKHEGAAWNGNAAILSELGSMQMEFYTLSQETGDPKYWNAARKAISKIRSSCGNGFCGRNFHNGRSSGGTAGYGSFGDSFYEYLLKVWILTGKTDSMFKEMWDAAAQHAIDTSATIDGVFVINGQETGHVMEHLACFSGGLYALSYIHTKNAQHLEVAEKIADTCHKMYEATPTGLAYDVCSVAGNGKFRPSEPKYILRPETVETYFYLWKATHNPKYRDWGEQVLRSINKHLKVDAGYVGATDVGRVPIRANDNMETFWFAETLKYLYLLFSEDEKIDLTKWVINTEAHPLKVQKPTASSR